MNQKLRRHFLANHAETKAWVRLIRESTHELPPRPLERAKISVVRHSHRMLDFDGLVGSLKPVIDALVTNEIIIDDGWKIVGAWQVHQRFKPKKDGPLLEILVQEMPLTKLT